VSESRHTHAADEPGESGAPVAAALPGESDAPVAEDRLGDFNVSPRLLLISSIAVVIGCVSAVVARLLLWLIAIITNLSYFGHFSTISRVPDPHRLGIWSIFIPVVGGLITGLMARYGSEKIRGHGIPEALEAILIGRSRIAAILLLDIPQLLCRPIPGGFVKGARASRE
jgi:H+/Cl- antiporter ClcA